PLKRGRLTGAGRGDAGHGDDRLAVDGADWALGPEDAEEAPEHPLQRPTAPLRVVSERGDVERVVAHPAGEQGDRGGGLARLQVPDLDRWPLARRHRGRP